MRKSIRKLTKVSKYYINDEGYAIIRLRLKGTSTWVDAFECHTECIPIIKAHGTLNAPNCYLVPLISA